MCLVIKCCGDCVAPKRHPGCHSTCPDYIQEKEEHVKLCESARQQKAAEFSADQVSRRAVDRIKARSRRRR